jgi:pimeloyl-ACP methyl ester carboxylesterase
MALNLPGSVVFITGTFLGNNCWDEWISFFESKGYTCLSPVWPYKDASPEELRNRHPDAAIASTRLAMLTDYYATIINALPEKPVLVGHSLGGLIVQLLLQRRIGAAGVAIHSFPPPGVSTLKFMIMKIWWQAMGFFTSTRKTYMVSYREWKYGIANGMNCDQQKELYYKYAIPESKLAVRDGFKCKTRINFENPHVPLLFTAGNRDQVIPAALNYRNYKKYVSGNSIIDYKEFNNHNHLVFDQPAAIEEADFILYWLKGISG